MCKLYLKYVIEQYMSSSCGYLLWWPCIFNEKSSMDQSIFGFMVLSLTVQFCRSDLVSNFWDTVQVALPKTYAINIVLTDYSTPTARKPESNYVKTLYKQNVDAVYARMVSESYLFRNMLKGARTFDVSRQEAYIFFSKFSKADNLDRHKLQNFCDLIMYLVNANSHILIHVSDKAYTEILFKDCPLEIDSNIMVYYINETSQKIRIEEVYKIDQNSPVMLHDAYASYYQQNVETVKDSHRQFRWKKRSDLHGHRFDAITGVWPPFIVGIEEKMNGSDRAKLASPKGMYVDVINLVLERINASISYTKRNGSWSSMVAAVSEKRMDLSVAGYSQTPSRGKLVDFSLGLMQTSLRIIYPAVSNKPWTAENALRQFYPFLEPTWVWIMIYAIVTAFLMFAVELLIMIDRNNIISLESVARLAAKSSSFSFFCLIRKEFEIEPTRTPGRVAFILMSLAGVYFFM